MVVVRVETYLAAAAFLPGLVVGTLAKGDSFPPVSVSTLQC